MKMLRALGISFFTIGLAAGCGGGGGGSSGNSPTPTSTTTAEGLYTGTSSNGRTSAGLVLDDGTTYYLYSAVGNPSVIAGVVLGNGASTGTTFTSNDARDFNFEGLGVMPVTVSGTYIANQSISGVVTYPGRGSVTFSGTYDPLYLATPSLATLAGTFTGQVATSAGIENAATAVMSNGALSGVSASGCSVTGTVTPRAHGNVYDISITFGGAPCGYPNQTLSGIAFFDASVKRMWLVAPNAARTDGVLFVGTKP